MAKEFKNNEMANLRDFMSITFLKDNEKVLKNIDKDTQVKIKKSEKLPKKEGSIGYYISIEIDGDEYVSEKVIAEHNFYTKNQWNERLYKKELIKKLQLYVLDKFNDIEDEKVRKEICNNIEKSLMSELLEEVAFKVLNDLFVAIDNENIKDVAKVSERFEEILDRELPF